MEGLGVAELQRPDFVVKGNFQDLSPDASEPGLPGTSGGSPADRLGSSLACGQVGFIIAAARSQAPAERLGFFASRKNSEPADTNTARRVKPVM